MIVAFCCNWATYPLKYLSQAVKIIRLPCAGSFEINFALDALRTEADGVLIIACKRDNCHYKTGAETTEKRVETARKILALLGYSENLIKFVQVSPVDAQNLNGIVEQHKAAVEKLQKPPTLQVTLPLNTKLLKTAFETTAAYYCVGCGKCTANCPLTPFDLSYSPRIIVERTAAKQYLDATAVYKDANIWKCYTCGLCYIGCPHNVKFYEFIRYLREGAQALGYKVPCSQGGVLQSIFRMMAFQNTTQNRLEGLKKNLKYTVAKKNDILYFTGCTPYLAMLFPTANLLEIPNSTLAILNELGVEPAVLPNEVCCGHDLLWLGEAEYFKKLALQNIEFIRKIAPAKIIFSCPECYRTFKIDYPNYFGDWSGIELLHISEFLDRLGEKLNFTKSTEKIVYHDSCRLGRHLNIYDEPRRVLSKIATTVELDDSKSKSACCGATAWVACSAISMQIQKARLYAAEKIAQKFITACPKCMIHYNCAFNSVEKKPNIIVEDFAVFVSKHLNLRNCSN